MKPRTTNPRPTPLGVTTRVLGLSWIALLLLMSASLGLSYLHLGIGNVVAGIGIACVKTGIVGWWFMQLRSTPAASRAAGCIALFLLAVLLTLSGVDYLTRLDEPAAIQVPKQIEPLAAGAG